MLDFLGSRKICDQSLTILSVFFKHIACRPSQLKLTQVEAGGIDLLAREVVATVRLVSDINTPSFAILNLHKDFTFMCIGVSVSLASNLTT